MLEKLYLANANDALISTVCNQCPPHLAKLVIHANNISDSSLHLIGSKMGKVKTMRSFELEIRSDRNDEEAITDVGITAFSRIGCMLSKLTLQMQVNVSDAGMKELARNCRNLRALDVSYCHGLTDKFVEVVALHCDQPNMQLNISGCSKITNRSLVTLSLLASDKKFLVVAQDNPSISPELIYHYNMLHSRYCHQRQY
jgi:hypothetical protein